MTTHAAPNLSSTLLQRIDGKRNMARFYALSVEPDLLGGVALVRRFGRIQCSERILIESFSTRGEAELQRARLISAKLRRGYRPGLARLRGADFVE